MGVAPRSPRAAASGALRRRATGWRNRVRFHAWLQFVAQEQWNAVRAIARGRECSWPATSRSSSAQDSADTWANPRHLRRDARLGVPPDEFSDTGQDWGLPYFDFEAMEKDDWGWLRLRALHAAADYDLRRVDHAVGYFRQYIRDEKTPKGRFLPPDEPVQQRLGERIFRLLSEGSGIVAEDLGVIPPFVRKTLAELQIPGYRVLRWEKDDRVYRNPHEFPEVSLVTTGTHDTETAREWWEALRRRRAHRRRTGLARVRGAASAAGPIHARGARPAPGHGRGRRLAAVRAAVAGRARRDRAHQPSRARSGDANWAYRLAAPVEELEGRDDVREATARLRTLTQAAGRLTGA